MIDLIKHHSGINYIHIKQTIEGNNNSQELKISPSIATDLISVLQYYQNELPKQVSKPSKFYFYNDKQQVVLERYFKGLTIEVLAPQFDCTIQVIEQILMNKKVPTVDDRLPKSKSISDIRKESKLVLPQLN